VKKMSIEKIKGTKAHQQYFTKDGTRVPGVTTITNQLSKGEALVAWAWNLGMKQIDYRKFRDKTAEIGTCAHYLVQCHLSKETPDLTEFSPDVIDKAENSLISYFEWEKSHIIEPLLLEEQKVSEIYKYGGTVDCYCLLNGVPTLIDFKTCNAIYDEQIMQVSGYRQLLLESGLEVKNVHILRIGRDETEGFEDKFIEAKKLEISWQIFLHLLQIYYLRREG